jgi:hypothetical protein
MYRPQTPIWASRVPAKLVIGDRTQAVILIVLILFGGGWYGRGRWF